MPDQGESSAEAVPAKPAAWPDMDSDKASDKAKEPAAKAADQPEWPGADYAWPGQDEPAAEAEPDKPEAREPAEDLDQSEESDKPERDQAAEPAPAQPEAAHPHEAAEPEKTAGPEKTTESDGEARSTEWPALASADDEPDAEVESTDREPTPEPTAEAEPTVEPAAAESEPESEPAGPEPIAEIQPVAEAEAEPTPQPTAEAESEPEPEDEPADEPEPTAQVEPEAIEPEPRPDDEPEPEPEPVAEAEPEPDEPDEPTATFPPTESDDEPTTAVPADAVEPEQRTDAFPIHEPDGPTASFLVKERTEPEERTASFPVKEPDGPIASFPVKEPDQPTATFPVKEPEQRTDLFPIREPDQRTETFPAREPRPRVREPEQRTQYFPVKPPEPTARMTPVADAATTQFLPRIDPTPPPPPPRRVERIESTQIIPVFRAAPTPAETTQHIPLPAETTQHIPTTRYDDEDDYDTGEQPAVADDEKPRRPRKKRALLVSAGVVIVVIAVGVAVVLTQPAIATKLGLRPIVAPTTQPPPSPVVFSAELKPPNGSAPMPSTSAVAGALAPLAANPAVGPLAGTVLDAATGQVLWDHGSTTPVAPASTNKLLTSAAALLTFSPQTTLDTEVVAGDQPGTIILVGGGDPTLNSLPAPQLSVYPGAARISDLAAQVKAHNPGQITRILVDVSKFTGPTSAPGWDPPSASQDNWAPIQPVMLDGGRLVPTKTDTPRTYSPALAAGQALAAQLGVPTSAVSTTTTPTAPGGSQLGLVHSATVPDLVTNLLQISDNVLAEVMGRMVAIADNQAPTFTGATASVLDTLRRNGFDTTGVSLSDSSGLSPSDRLTPRLLAQVLRVAASSDTSDPRVAKLRPLLLGLPIAGSPVGDGTLAGRYQTAPSSAGKGWVRAKTGTLSAQGVYALAGVVLDADGRVLVFALVSNQAPSGLAPTVLDTMAATLRGCGCR